MDHVTKADMYLTGCKGSLINMHIQKMSLSNWTSLGKKKMKNPCMKINYNQVKDFHVNHSLGHKASSETVGQERAKLLTNADAVKCGPVGLYLHQECLPPQETVSRSWTISIL